MSDISLTFSGFEWDRGNRYKNLRKHGVSRTEAEENFFGCSLVYPDLRHSTDMERRLVLFGETAAGRPLLVAFTIRGTRIRVISARPMSDKERSWYAEEKRKVGVGG